MTNQTTTLRVEFVSESAGFENTFGWYNKVTGIGGILFANVEAEGSNAPLRPGVSSADFTVNTADVGNIEYFLIPNGGDISANSDAELSGGVKVIQLSDGAWAVATLNSHGTVQTGSNGKPNILTGEGANAFFTEKTKNEGSTDHASSVVGSSQTAAALAGDTADGATGLIAWEDLAATKKSNGTWTAPGDADYNDAVFRVSIKNDKPDAKKDSVAVSEDAGATAINVLGNDTDANGDSLKVVSVNASNVLGTISMAADGSGVIFNPGVAYQYLGAGESKTETFTYKIDDGHGGTDTATVTLKIVGANDAPVIVGAADLTGSVTERADGAWSENTGTLSTVGNISFSDVDRNDDDHTVSVAPQASGYRGTLTAVISNGGDCDPPNQVTWNYSVGAGALDNLSAGQTLTQLYTVTISDGHGGSVAQTVTITLVGTNDKPTITSAVAAATVTELADGASGENSATLTSTGNIQFADVDLADSHTLSVTPVGSGYLGTLTASVSNAATGDGTGAVTWVYSVNDGALDDLIAGQTLTQTYTIKINDGQGGIVSQNVTITIKGAADGAANSVPVITSGVQAGSVTEIADGTAGENTTTLSQTGTITFSDSNVGDTHTATVVPQGVGYLGTLALGAVDQSGDSVGWTFSVADSVLDSLQAGQVLTQKYDVTVNDGEGGTATTTVTVTLNGSNDAATISSDSKSVTESNAASALNTSGQLAIADPDSGQAHVVAQTNAHGTYGDFSVDANGVWTYLGNGTHNELTAGQQVQDQFTVVSQDGTASGTVTVTITGTNDAATVSSQSKSVTEGDAASALNTSGQLTVTDPDNGQAHVAAQTNVHGVYGDFSIDANGAWTYTGNGAHNELTAGQQVQDQFTVVSQDGTASGTVTVTITGSNDAATVSTDSKSVTEGDAASALNTSGQLVITDPDSGQAHVAAQTNVHGVYGDFNIDADGAWTYTGNGAHNELTAGQQVQDQFTVVSQDGTASGTVTVNITGTDDAPATVSLDGNHVVNENDAGAVIGAVSATDVDTGDIVTFSVDDARFEVANGNLKLRDGISLNFEQEPEVLVTVRATDATGQFLDQGFTINVVDGFESLAIDGYIAGATVFADANGNGTWDDGEVSATTDALGNFTLFGGSGQLVMTGGIDISTNQAFTGIMKAPEGSTVVTPLTTLVVAIAQSNPDYATDPEAALQTAQGQLLQSLGLDTNTDLSTFDPVAATLSSDSNAQAQGQAAMAAAVQIQNTIVQAASLIQGAGNQTGTSTISLETALAAVVNQLAVQISNQTLDLNDTSAIQSMITAAVSATSTDQDVIDAVTNAAAGAANVITAGNAVIENAVTSGQTGTDLLTTLAQVSIVAQGDAAAALNSAGAGDTSISEAEGNFTGDALDDAVSDAVAGNVAGVNADDTIVGTADADALLGYGGNDTISGLAGNDILVGGDGNDALDGGDGRDRASFADATGNVSINLTAGTATGAGIGTDSLQSIEIVRGSNFDDTYVATNFGSAGAVNIGSFGTFNQFEGMGGNDTVTGNGVTGLSFQSATGGVTVNFTGVGTGTAFSTGAGDAAGIGTDTFSGVGSVRGSSFDDLLQGSGNTATVEIFVGGRGNDTIDGRGGLDRAVYSPQTENDVTSGVSINMASGIVTGDASVGTDTLRGVEFVRGSNFADSYDATGFNGASANAGSNGTFNEIEGMAGNDTITGNGNTRVAFYNATAGVTVDLAAGSAMGDASVGTDTWSTSLINSFVGGINAIAGSQFGDFLYGSNNAANTSEQFDGRAGDDFFDGRGGFDTAVYNNDVVVTAGISVNMAAGFVTGDAAVGTDTLRAIESVRGTNFADTYNATNFGVSGANVGSSGTFNDFEGMGGDDIVIGNNNTRVTFTNSGAGVTVDLQAGTATGSAIGSDTLSSVSQARGSNFDDTISGNSSNNVLDGQNGNDRLDGRGGNDTLTGGGNADTFVYGVGYGADVITDFNRVAGDKVDLSGIAGMNSLANVQAIASNVGGVNTLLSFGGSNTLTLNNVSVGSLVSSDFVFSLVGDANSNTITGTAANETLQGLDGDDTLQGAGGNDILQGGNGRDRASYIDASGGITVDLAAGTVTGAGVGTDTLNSIEIVRGSNNDDVMVATGFSATSTNAASITSNGTPSNAIFEGMGGNDTITGTGATLISYQSALAGVTVTFSAPGVGTAFSTTGGDAAGVGTDSFTGVSFVRGSNYDDTFTGTTNTTGVEQFIGGRGNDFINGGGGFDRASYAPLFDPDPLAASGVTVNMAAGTVSGDAAVGADTLRAIEAIRGTDFDDTYDATNFGISGANVGSSGTFNEFEGMAGNDTITGNGNTRLSYNLADAGVTVDLAAHSVTGNATVGTDTLAAGLIGGYAGGVNAIIGSQFDDTIRGSANGAGTTELFEGRDGDDLIDGRGGYDVAIYGNDSLVLGPINVNMAAGTVTGDPAVGTDTLVEIESVRGTSFNDTFVATGFNGASADFPLGTTFNEFEGLGGDDTITGNGNTRISFQNTAVAAGNGVTVDLAAGTASGAATGNDTFSLVSRARGSNNDDTISGDANNNTLEGLNGNDRLDGRGGSDTLTGGTGNDTFVYGVGYGADVVTDFGAGDKIDLSAIAGINSFADVQAIALTSGGNTVLDFGGGNTLTLNGVAGASLSSGQFVYSLVGNENSNTITGTAANETLQGMGGDDTLIGGGGNDYLDGGNGRDRASYVDATGAMTINLAAGTASGAGVGSDTLYSIELIRGSNFDDSINAAGFSGTSTNPSSITNTGLPSNPIIEGMGGNDTITGNGASLISYQSATAGVTVTFSAPGVGTATSTAGGDAAGIGNDSFTGVSFVRGSIHADTFTGSGTNTSVEQFTGGGGDDFINGQGGFDRASYFSQVEDDTTGGVTIDLRGGVVTGNGSVGVDQIRSIESIRGTSFNDSYDATGFSQSSGTNQGSAGQDAAGNAFNEFEGMGGADSVIGNGNTKIAFYNATAGVTVDLAAGTATGDSSVGSDSWSTTVINNYAGGINSVAGSQFNDVIYGTINANNTTEQFEGRGGNDTFDGRGGFDMAVYNLDNLPTGGINVNMAAGTVTGDAAVGTDMLIEIESVRGTNFNDTFVATGFVGASAQIAAGVTFNEFEGLGGNDTITGNGNTRISFVSSASGVTVDLAGGTTTGASIGSDLFTGVSRVRGSNSNDTISGDANNNTLEGQNGNDRLDGRAGNDTLTGGGNADTFVFGVGYGADVVTDFNAGQSDLIDFSAIAGINSFSDVQAIASQSGANTVFDFGSGNTLTLNNVLPGALSAGFFVYSLVGNENSNTITGTVGNDTLQGMGGDDTLIGGSGDDYLDGGNGRDRASYVDATGGITLNLGLGTVSGAGVGSDTLYSIEIVRGSNFNDTLVVGTFNASSANPSSITNTGAPSNPIIEGMGGDDIITGNNSTLISYQSAAAAVTVAFSTPGVGTATSTAGGDAAGIGNDTFSGVSSVRGSAFDDTLTGSNNTTGFEQFTGGNGNDFINGMGGFDRVAYFSQVEDDVTGGVAINMRAGTVQGDASVDLDQIRSVEAVRGSSFDDTYDARNFSSQAGNGTNVGSAGGDANNNALNEFEGMGGTDTVFGNGNTRIAFYNATAGVTVDLAAGSATGDASVGTDTWSTSLTNNFVGGINSIAGSQFNDTFYGSDNPNNTAELFEGRGGDDTFYGRKGFDVAVYNADGAVTGAISVNMANGTVTGNSTIGVDTLVEVESVRGTNFADTYVATGYNGASIDLTPGTTFNEFEGLGGNDSITGNGNTRISFQNTAVAANLNTNGVTVDLALGTASGAATGNDTFSLVNRVRGSNNNDTISGDGNVNFLEGQNGDDRIDGRGGNDTLTGGTGIDAFIFTTPANGFDTITDWKNGADFLEFTGSAFGGLAAGSSVTLVSGTDVASAVGLAANSFYFDTTGTDQGTVYFDATGGSGIDAVALVRLQNNNTPASSVALADFHVV